MEWDAFGRPNSQPKVILLRRLRAVERMRAAGTCGAAWAGEEGGIAMVGMQH